MWIIIIVAVIIVGILAFKHFDRDFIKATKLLGENNIYALSFENGKKPVCYLADVFDYEGKKYYVFIPTQSLKNVPLEDVIVLERYKEKEDEQIFVFADEETDKYVMENLISKYQKNRYGKNFVLGFLD